MDGSLFGTNLVTIDGSEIKTGQAEIGKVTGVQVTTETGPLNHGIMIIPISSANYWVNTAAGSPNVTSENGIFVKFANPLFIPIKDPSVIRIISQGATKMVSWIAY